MTRLSRIAITALVCALTCVPAGAAAAPQEPLPRAGQPEPQVDPPAHVSVVDGVAVLERDGQIDDSPANMPLLAGDRVRTRSGRVEILFADGATLHLDANTVVDFQSDELVRLLEGRIRLAIPGPFRAVDYRVDAPSGWAQITQPGEYRLAILRGPRGEEMELAVLRGAADLLTDAGRTSLRAGERAYARRDAAPSSAYVFNSASWDAFDRWSESLRDDRLGVSAQYLPDEVRPYAASFDRYGSWRNDPSYGYVWYPTVSADWRPYYHGRWVSMPAYGWTWVGRERWDWPTHHYGRWGLSGGVWFWIPGRNWGAAWVSWAYAPDYVSWCPLGWNNRPIIQINVFNGRDRWHPWTVVPRRHFGAGYVHARAVPFRGFDERVRGSFTYRNSGPDYRDYPRARASAPIRTAGTRTERAVPRGSAPIYTNRAPDGARTDGGSRRVMVQPSPATSPSPRSEPDTPARSRAVPRSDVDSRRSDIEVQPRGARPGPGSIEGRAAVSPRSEPVPDDGGRRGVRVAPRSEPGPDERAPMTSRPSRGIERGTSTDPNASVWRGRAEPAPVERSRPVVRERSAAPPADYARPAPSTPYPAAPSYGSSRERRAPESDSPSGMRAVPRGGVSVPADRGQRPSEARPGGGAPPSARPADRPSQGDAPGARPRSGGERTSGTARRRGGV